MKQILTFVVCITAPIWFLPVMVVLDFTDSMRKMHDILWGDK